MCITKTFFFSILQNNLVFSSHVHNSIYVEKPIQNINIVKNLHIIAKLVVFINSNYG